MPGVRFASALKGGQGAGAGSLLIGLSFLVSGALTFLFQGVATRALEGPAGYAPIALLWNSTFLVVQVLWVAATQTLGRHVAEREAAGEDWGPVVRAVWRWQAALLVGFLGLALAAGPLLTEFIFEEAWITVAFVAAVALYAPEYFRRGVFNGHRQPTRMGGQILAEAASPVVVTVALLPHASRALATGGPTALDRFVLRAVGVVGGVGVLMVGGAWLLGEWGLKVFAGDGEPAPAFAPREPRPETSPSVLGYGLVEERGPAGPAVGVEGVAGHKANPRPPQAPVEALRIAAGAGVEHEQGLARGPRGVFGGAHERRPEALSAGTPEDQHLRDVRAVRLVLRLRQHHLDGADDPAPRPLLGHQQGALAGGDALGHAPPERVGPLPRQRRHKADGGPALDAVDQDLREGRDATLRLPRREGTDVDGSRHRGPRVSRHRPVGRVAEGSWPVEAHGERVALRCRGGGRSGRRGPVGLRLDPPLPCSA